MQRLPILLVLVLALTGCKKDTFDASVWETSSGSEIEDEGLETGYTDEARTLYERALNEFRKRDCVEAEPLFRRVRREYPYSRFAALAQLRIADCQMSDSSYAEAVQSYSNFVRYNASHRSVAYARFRIAQAHFKQIPTDWFLVPPSFERDLGSAQDALKYLRKFILDFPDDSRVPDALEMTRKALKVLAGHELYAGQYYLRRGAPQAAVLRIEILLERYAGSELDAEAYYTLGRAYRALELPRRARNAFETVLDRFSASEFAAEAERELGELPALPAETSAED